MTQFQPMDLSHLEGEPTEEQTQAIIPSTPQPAKRAEIVKANVPIIDGRVSPDSLEGMFRLAGMYAAANLVPKSLEGRSPEETRSRVCVAIEAGMGVGLTPNQALQYVMVVNQRPCLWGDAPLALVRRSPWCVGVTEGIEGLDDQGNLTPRSVAVCVAVRRKPDNTIETIERRFSAADAATAGLKGKNGPWSNYPKRMMQLRARAFALRDAFPDVILGLGIAEEYDDFRGEQSARLEDVQSRVAALPSGPAKDVVVPMEQPSAGGKTPEVGAAPARPDAQTPAKGEGGPDSAPAAELFQKGKKQGGA